MTHQIRILAGAKRYDGNKITVSCSCLDPIRWHRPRGVIEARPAFPAAEAKAAWAAWHEREGIVL